MANSRIFSLNLFRGRVLHKGSTFLHVKVNGGLSIFSGFEISGPVLFRLGATTV